MELFKFEDDYNHFDKFFFFKDKVALFLIF